MQVHLIFDTTVDSPSTAQTHLNGMKWALVAWDMDQFLRGELKYNSDTVSKSDPAELVEKIRAKLHSIMEEKGVSLEEIE